MTGTEMVFTRSRKPENLREPETKIETQRTFMGIVHLWDLRTQREPCPSQKHLLLEAVAKAEGGEGVMLGAVVLLNLRGRFHLKLRRHLTTTC